MREVTYEYAQQHLGDLMGSVIDDAEEVLITRAGHPPVVVVLASEWTSLRETDYLLRNPANAAFLRRGIAELDAGRGEVHDLTENPR